MIGKFAVSRAGHDRDRLYVIVAREDGLVCLCDGRLRPLSKPKRKKEKHIQIINRTVGEDLLKRLREGRPASDEEIRLELKNYGSKRDEKPDEG